MTPAETTRIFEQVTIQVVEQFSLLTVEQLNFKPAADKWSIAQCLHHLIVSNSTYYPQLNAVVAQQHNNTFYQNIRFISRFFGRWLIKETGPVVTKPMKNPAPFAPAQSHFPMSVITDFANHQREFTSLLLLLSNTDLQNTVISSPALRIITYNLEDLLTILAGHEQRHLQQALRVKALL